MVTVQMEQSAQLEPGSVVQVTAAGTVQVVPKASLQLTPDAGGQAPRRR